MATVQVTVCDECGRQKQEANHWFAIEENNGSLIMFRLAKLAADFPKKAVSPEIKHMCSQKCLTSIGQRWMDTGSIEKAQVIDDASA